MNIFEILTILGKMGYTKDDVAKMLPVQPQVQPQVKPQVQPQVQPQTVDYLSQMMQLFAQPQTQVQPLTQTQVQTQVDNGIEAQLKALTQAVQLNNVNSIANARTLPTTADDVIASIINPPVNIPDNTIK